MMKKIYITALASLGILSLGGCTNLDEKVYDRIPEGGFYKTETEMISAMGPIYSNMRSLTDWQKWWDMEETTDIVLTPVRGGWAWFDNGIFIRLHQHTWIDSDPHFNDIWNQLFNGVNTSNRVLYQFENSTVVMPERDSFIAELKIARAYYYYMLIEIFGNIPIVDKFDVPEGYLPATKSRAEVFSFLEKDIKENMDKLSENTLSTYGRFNRWNARLLLARLYLNAEAWIGTPMYSQCSVICDEIIAANKYMIDDDYSMTFSVNNDLSKESMFVVPFDETMSGGQIYNMMRKTVDPSQASTWDIKTWLDGGVCGVPSFFDNYIANDKRLEKTWLMGQQFALDGSPILASGIFGEGGTLLIYTQQIRTHPDGNFAASSNDGYRCHKYEIKIGARETPDNDWVVMRYSEVLMTKAECILRTNGDANDAANLVNDVRARAFDTPVALTGAELMATIDYNGVFVKHGRLLQELGVEFALEGVRRSQLIRFDDNYTKGTWSFHTPSNDTKRNLCPIPFAQMQSNPNLIQNP